MSESIRDNRNLRKPRAKQRGVFVGTRFQPELLKLLDEWRRNQPDIPNRPEAIRRLVEKATRDAESG